MWLFFYSLSTLKIVTALGTHIIFWLFFCLLVQFTVGNNYFSSSREAGGLEAEGPGDRRAGTHAGGRSNGHSIRGLKTRLRV